MKKVVTTSLFGPMLESLQWCKMIIEPAQTEQNKQNHKQLHLNQHKNTLRQKRACVTRAGIDPKMKRIKSISWYYKYCYLTESILLEIKIKNLLGVPL